MLLEAPVAAALAAIPGRGAGRARGRLGIRASRFQNGRPKANRCQNGRPKASRCQDGRPKASRCLAGQLKGGPVPGRPRQVSHDSGAVRMAKILIVDDDPALREWLKLILRNQKHDVRSVETGEAFFAALDHQVPDIALVDVLLAGMNGMQIVKRLRAEPRTAALPVVMISMLRQDKYLEQAAGLGADDYLVKPLVAADVIGVVQARLAARQDAQASDVNAQAG